MQVIKRMESEVRSYCRSFPVVFSKAKGPFLYTDDGVKYLDFLSGAGTLNYGHNNPIIKEKLLAYIEGDGLVHGLDMTSSAKSRFLETLDELILKPRALRYKVQFPGPTGANVVEAAFKLARKITGRTNIVSFTNGFHGVSLGALAATGNSFFRDVAGVDLGGTTFMPYDGYMENGFDTIAYFEKTLVDHSSGLDKPAAVIVETVQGEGGVNVASAGWLRRLRSLCSGHDILMIVDDIQVGNGRTGAFFSFEDSGIVPDMVTLSKSLGAFGLPMSALLIKPEFDQWSPGEHNGTFRGHNLAFVAATEALLAYWKDDAFEKDIAEKGTAMARGLASIARRFDGLSVRGRGMIRGLVFDDPDKAARTTALAFERGLIIETSGARGEVVKLLPSLTIDRRLLEEGIDILETCVATVYGADREEVEAGPALTEAR